MAEIIDFKDKVRRYYKPSGKEMLGMVIAILTVAFIISFREWGGETFNLAVGLSNFLLSILIVGVSFLAFDAGQRLWGLAINYRINYRVFSFGLILGVIVCFLTNGKIWVILPSGFLIEHLTAHRLGWFRYGINLYGQGLVALGGPIASIFLIILLKIFGFLLPAAFAEKAILFNVVFAITQMIPIPPLAGSKTYFGSKMTYAFNMPAIVACLILLSLDIPILLSLLLAFLIGVMLWISYYIFFEQNLWKGPS